MYLMAGEGVQVFMCFNSVLTEMFTVRQAAYHYNFSMRTIQKWIDEGKITPVEIEGRNWLKKEDLEKRIMMR